MAIDYRDKSERIRNRYLYPENDDASLSDVLVPAAEYLAFFTPLGGWLGKQIGKGIRGAWQGATRYKGTKALSTVLGRPGMKGSPGASETIFAAGNGLAKSAGPGAVGAAETLRGAKENAWNWGKGWDWKNGFSGFKNFSGKGFQRTGAAISSLANFVGRNPGKIALAAGAVGALSAMRERPKAQPIADIGMGYPAGTTWVKQYKKKGMDPNRLGASGDLVFAMRGAR